MEEIRVTFSSVPIGETSVELQLENTKGEEINRECAQMLLAIAAQEVIAIDFVNEAKAVAGYLKSHGISYSDNAPCPSLKVNPKDDPKLLWHILREFGFTSQQFATGTEQQIERYLRDNQRIKEYKKLLPGLISIGQLECYKDRIELTSNLSRDEILRRLEKLPYHVRNIQ